mgnify:CR=1 FL=1
MKLLSEERFKRLAEKSGWTVARAQGFSEGSVARARGTAPSSYAVVGTDDYCMGYREGYFARPSGVLNPGPSARGDGSNVSSS